MEYDAITLDANIFIRNALNLEGGMLQQLHQFKRGSVQFILSEIIIRELVKHLNTHAHEANEALGSAIKKAARNALLTADAMKQADVIHAAATAPEDAVKTRLAEFIQKSGCTVVAADKADMTQLIKMYFDSLPPFEASGKKRKEFPDAIALLTLEAWAKEHNKTILAISEDSGWADYAQKSEWITVEKELPLALQRLQEHSDAARKVVGAWLADLGAGKNPVAFDKLTDSIANSVNKLSPNVEATSAFYYEHDTVTLTFASMEFWRNAETEEVDFYIVQIGKRIIVVKVDLRLTAALEADFTFGRYDSIDRDYVRLGDNHLEGQVEFNASALVTIVGDLSKRPTQLAIEAVELVDVDNTIDFGEIEPDYGGDQEAD